MVRRSYREEASGWDLPERKCRLRELLRAPRAQRLAERYRQRVQWLAGCYRRLVLRVRQLEASCPQSEQPASGWTSRPESRRALVPQSMLHQEWRQAQVLRREQRQGPA